MKAKYSGTLSFLFLLIFIFPVNAFAVVWDISNEDLEKVAFELKKFNTHLENLKNSELASLRGQQENLARQIEEIKQILPQLLGAVELNKSQTLSGLNKTNTKLDDLEAEVKNQVLDKIHQQNKNLELFRQGQESLKVGLAQDMEKFERASRKNFEEFATANNETLGRVVQQLESQSATNKKGFNDTIALFRTEVIPAMAAENENSRKLMLNQLTQAKKETQKNLEAFSAKNQQLNQKLIEILQESLKQGLDTKSLLDAIKNDLAITQESLVGTNQNLADNQSVITEIQKSMVVTNKNLMVADEKSNKLADSLKALQAQNIASNETLGVLKTNLKQSSEFNKLADEKFNKLIDLSSKLAGHSKELEGAVKESAQRDDAGNAKVDLANEKLSRLIEILKTIVQEQAKLDPVATTLGNLQKEQGAMQKAQESFRKNQEEIKEALADLRRKANVSISRSDDIKKTLDQLRPAQKGAGGP